MASKTVHLIATYTNTSPSVTEPRTLTLSSTPLSLPTGEALTVESKTTYLASLRAAAVAMQESINAELTRRMEEDIKNAAAAGVGATTQEAMTLDKNKATKREGKNKHGAADALDEVAEEENYGEEVPEDEDKI